jgi:hypothetical protein
VLAADPCIDRRNGRKAFDRRLVVANRDAATDPEHYRALLSRDLMRAELPRAIEVVSDFPGYKKTP